MIHRGSLCWLAIIAGVTLIVIAAMGLWFSGAGEMKTSPTRLVSRTETSGTGPNGWPTYTLTEEYETHTTMALFSLENPWALILFFTGGLLVIGGGIILFVTSHPNQPPAEPAE